MLLSDFKKIVYRYNLIAGIIISFFMGLAFLLSNLVNGSMKFEIYFISTICYTIYGTFMWYIASVCGNWRFVKFLQNNIGKIAVPTVYFLVGELFIVLYSIIITNVKQNLVWLNQSHYPDFYFPLVKVINVHLLFFILHGILFFVNKFFQSEKDRNKIALENEQLKQENIKAQLEALKQQINPHFLFNALNSLKALVHEKPENCEKFIIQLANVYRYVLNYKPKPLVKVIDELDFIKSYFYLLKIRFDTGLFLNIAVSKAHENMLMPPLTLQILLENTVKHNVIATAKPLTISIKSDTANNLVISNNLQVKATEGEGTGNFGLYNINQQFKHFCKKEILINNAEGIFSVTIPLLKENYEHHNN